MPSDLARATVTRHGLCAEQVRRLDPDRYVTALFAPVDRRADLLALYAFNTEVARIREAVSEPMLGRIRLQWWREAIAECYEGQPREHFIVIPLADAIRRHNLTRNLFETLIEARERDFDERPFLPFEELMHYARDSSGSLVRLALDILGAQGEATQAAGERVGTAWALIGMMRALPHRIRLGQPVLPVDLLRRHDLGEYQPGDLRPSAALSKVIEEVAVTAAQEIDISREHAGGVQRHALPALLLAPLAQAYLKRLARTGFDPFDAGNSAPLRFPAWRLIPRAAAGRY